MGAENPNPLDELKSLDQQVDRVTELAELKPIFYRLDEIAKQCSDDFEVQLVVGDIKQHLVNRGTKLKEKQQASPAPPPLPATKPAPAPPPLPPAVKPTVKLMSSGLFPKSSPPSPQPPATPPVIPPTVAIPRPPPATPPQPPPIARPGPSVTPAISPIVAAPRTLPAPATPPPTSTQTSFAATTEHATPPAPTVRLSKPPQTPAAPPPQQPPPAPPRSPLNWKKAMWLGALAGSVVSIVLIALLVNQARKRNPKEPSAGAALIRVDITTTPPGAVVRVTSGQPGGETKCTSNCTMPLAAGNYQVTAFLDGYEPATTALTVTAGQPASVGVALQPQAQTVRILTDLDQGKVAFDDQPPADLQEGQFIIDKVPPGPHTVKITGKSGDASFAFEIADAKPPAITGPVSTHNLIAVLVSSLGGQARVVTNSGPVKVALNGEPQGDAGPGGVDLKNFQPGVDELLIGDGKDQRNMKESFGPAPMLTAFLKSDVNMGTLIVSAGEDDVRVFVNATEYRRHTQRGQVRIPTIGPVSVRVMKDGFQNEPPQTAEVKKGAEVRLEFKLRALPSVGVLQIHGATAGAEVLLDQYPIGTVGADGNLTYNAVLPGDHTIELKRDQFAPKKLQRTFHAGQSVVLTGAEVTLAGAATTPGTGTVRLTRTPADATVTYHRADETQGRELRESQIDLPPGSYVFSARAPGYTERTERVQVTAGETRSIQLALARERQAAPATKTGDIADFEEPWRQEGDLWVHKGGGFIGYKAPPKGVFTFTVQLIKGGVFRGRIRWCVQYVDSKNYLLYELDKKNFWAEVVENGKKTERGKIEHKQPEKQKEFTLQIELTPDHVVHRMRINDQWVVMDTFAESGRNFASGKFGFLIQGSDEIGISNFSFQPK